jgi:hypothetical protein
MVIRTPVGGGIRGGHYHSQSPEALLHPHAGPEGRVPVEPLRRQGPARSGRSATTIRCCSSSPSASTAPPRATCPRATSPCRSARRVVRRASTSRSSRGARCSTRRSIAAAEGRGEQGIDGRGRRPAHALAARHRHDPRSSVEEDRPRRRRARGAQELRLRRGDPRARLREGVPPPRGAAGARHGLRHAVPVHARERVPAPTLTASSPRSFETASTEMARFEFKLPDIGEGVAEGEIVGWLVKAGEASSRKTSRWSR